MLREFLRAKIHRATVTEANLDYIGSITIPKQLCRQLHLGDGEKVDVLNISTGSRISTYVIYGAKDKYYCLNGAAAHLFSPGDKIIIVNYCMLNDDEVDRHVARIALVGDDNAVHKIRLMRANPDIID